MLESSPPRSKLQEYIVSVGNEAGYKTVTATVTGVSTETTTGLSTAWGQTEYSGGLSTTTTAKHTTSGVGTVATISGSAVTKVVVVTDTPTGSTTDLQLILQLLLMQHPL